MLLRGETDPFRGFNEFEHGDKVVIHELSCDSAADCVRKARRAHRQILLYLNDVYRVPTPFRLNRENKVVLTLASAAPRCASRVAPSRRKPWRVFWFNGYCTTSSAEASIELAHYRF